MLVPMRRRHLLAAVLMIAAIACFAPFRWEIWFAVAYESVRADDGLAYSQKRAAWLPGHPCRVPDQVCPACQDGTAHSPIGPQGIEILYVGDGSDDNSVSGFCIGQGYQAVDPRKREIWIPVDDPKSWSPVEFAQRRKQYLEELDTWSCTCRTCYP